MLVSRRLAYGCPLPGGGNTGGASGSKEYEDARHLLAHFRREAAGALRGHRPPSPPMRGALSVPALGQESLALQWLPLGGAPALRVRGALSVTQPRATSPKGGGHMEEKPLRLGLCGFHIRWLAEARISQPLLLTLCGFYIRWLLPPLKRSPSLPEGGKQMPTSATLSLLKGIAKNMFE